MSGEGRENKKRKKNSNIRKREREGGGMKKTKRKTEKVRKEELEKKGRKRRRQVGSNRKKEKKKKKKVEGWRKEKEEACLSLKTSEKPSTVLNPSVLYFIPLSCASVAEGERGREPRSDSNAMASPKVVPMEDFVQALMDYLVNPVLPLKSAARDAPSISQQQRVAKQKPADITI